MQEVCQCWGITSVYPEMVSSCPKSVKRFTDVRQLELFPLFIQCTLKRLLQGILKWFQVAPSL